MATIQRQQMTSGGGVTGSSNAAMPGSIAPAGSWFGERRKWRIISLSFSSPVPNWSLPS